MAGKPCVPRKLTRADVREGFDSREKVEGRAPELDEWLARFSWQNQRANDSVTYVSVLDGRVVGYYAIAVANVTSESAPVAVVKGAPRQVPFLLLARLAVDRSMQGFGLGRALLIDALRRTVGIAESVGIRALLVHARDDAARQFYLAQAEFLESPSDPLHLLLPVKDIVRAHTP
ncbi:MAG: GNAT family N-acetyltransferase [Nocardioidaceae bacterium]